MWSYQAVARVESGHEDNVAGAVRATCPGVSLERLECAGGAIYATFRIRTHATQNAVGASLHGVRGITILRISRPGVEMPARLRTRAFWVVASMAAAWAVFILAGIAPDSPLLLLNQAHLFVIQMSFTLAVALLVYVSDRDTAARAAGDIDCVRARSDEINERVKGLEDRER